MRDDLVIDVDDLVGHLEAVGQFAGERPVSLRLGDATVNGPMLVSGSVTGTIDGVLVRFTATAPAHLVCVRCLAEWADDIEVAATRHFSTVPDEDGYHIRDRKIDLTGPAVDELALGLPPAPLCRKDCRGLCPICGSDLNTEPCDGHGDESDSPFAALKDLFDSR
jgi:uncharacterized protein